jgi:hypothetical protein
MTGSGRRITVDPAGNAWMVNSLNQIWRYPKDGPDWQLMPGAATDIAAGADGTLWAIGTTVAPGGYTLQKWNGTNWPRVTDGSAVRIAIAKDGSPWVVNNENTVFRYNLLSRTWEVKGSGRSVHTGAASGAVWVIGGQAIGGGYPIQRWNPGSNTAEGFGSYGAAAVTEVGGTPWIVQEDGGVYAEIVVSLIQLGPTITINPTLNSPVMPPLAPTTSAGTLVGMPAQPTPAKLLCSVGDAGSYNYCMDARADFVGAYKFSTYCSEGFYDPLYGGTCWKCPADTDGGGAWYRSADSVEKDTACWRAPKERWSAATLTKAPGWPWECPSGSFWDGYSPDGIGGSCWRCPTAYPRRSQYPVHGNYACVTPVNETKPAKLLSYNSCPKPDRETMNLPGKRMPGKPFLDIAAGGCFACPVMNDEGNVLITARNADPIYNHDNNTGCRINFKYQLAQFVEPGLSGLRGVKEVIWEKRLFEGDRITDALYYQAASRGNPAKSPEAQAWVAAQWKEISQRPYNNEAFRLHIFALLKAALAKTKITRTAGEQMLIQSMEEYIVRRRSDIPAQALAMYDAWKKYSDTELAQRAQSQLETAFYYGTVPLDFNTLGSTLSLGGVASGVVGSMVAAQVFSAKVAESPIIVEAIAAGVLDGTEAIAAADRAGSLYNVFSKPLNVLLKAPSGVAAVAGASIIAVVGAIMSSVAIEQFVEIQTARTKLEASLALAKQPVSLDELYKGTNGEDLLYYYWGKAVDTTDLEDREVLTVAAAAYNYAQQRGFKLP